MVKDSKRRVALASDDEDEEDYEIDSEQETEMRMTRVRGQCSERCSLDGRSSIY